MGDKVGADDRMSQKFQQRKYACNGGQDYHGPAKAFHGLGVAEIVHRCNEYYQVAENTQKTLVMLDDAHHHDFLMFRGKARYHQQQCIYAREYQQRPQVLFAQGDVHIAFLDETFLHNEQKQQQR